MKHLGLLISLIMIVSLLAACATPTPEIVKEIVTQVVEVEKEVTKIVAGTPVVEKVIETKVVEKEVTRVVEVEKVVTATPEPKEPVVVRLAIPSDPMTLEPGLFLSLYTSEISLNLHVDNYTLKVTLSEPDPGFLMRLATTPTWVVPAESVVEGKPEWVDKPVGAGPFKFVEWKRNERIVLEAFDDFFLGRPQIDRIEYYIVPDATTEVAMYEGGELDIAAVPHSELDRLQADPDLSEELHYWVRARMIALIMNYDLVPEFGDLRVRQALAHTINRQQLAEVVMRNAVMAAEGLVPPGIPSYDPNLKGAEYDPEKAQQLLAEAGYPEGAGFPSLGISAYGENIGASEAVAAMLNTNLGIDIVVNQMERGEMVSAMWAKDELPLLMKGWTADFPSAEVWLHQWLRCGVESNFANYCNPEYDEIVDQAMSTSDPQEQTRLWSQVERIAMDDMAMIPLMYNRYIYLVKPYVQNFRCNFGGPMGLWDVKAEK